MDKELQIINDKLDLILELLQGVKSKVEEPRVEAKAVYARNLSVGKKG